MVKPLRHRTEALAEQGLVCCGQHRKGTSVERPARTEYPISVLMSLAVLVTPGHLDSRLIRLNAGITEKRMVKAGMAGQPVGQFFLLGDPVQI